MGWVQQIPQGKVCESSSYSFPWTCQGVCFLRHIPSRQEVLSEIIVVMRLSLQNKPAFVSSLDVVGSVLWLEGWVKIQIMPPDAGVATQQALLFPGNILLLFLLLRASSYASLPTMLCPFKILITEIVLQLSDLLLSPPWSFPSGKQPIQLLTDHFIPACLGYCLPTTHFPPSRLVINYLPTSPLSSSTQEAGEAQT